MNLSEFKAWFEGFTEAMTKPPTIKQWARITERVSEITSGPTPWPVFFERYYEPYRPYFPSTPYWVSICGEGSQTITSNSSNNCFADAGRAEVMSLTA